MSRFQPSFSKRARRDEGETSVNGELRASREGGEDEAGPRQGGNKCGQWAWLESSIPAAWLK